MWRMDGEAEALTFGSSEQKVVGAVNTQDSFTVSLRHVNALQRRRAAALSGRHRVDNSPGKKDTHL